MKYLPALLLAVSLPSANAFAQDQPTANPAAQDNGHITLDVTVSSKKEAAVSGLAAKDFTVLDNKTTQSIASFRVLTGAETQTNVVLVLDSVNLKAERTPYERDQVEHFLAANGGHLAQPTKLVLVTSKGIKADSDFTTDGGALKHSLDQSNFGMRGLAQQASLVSGMKRMQMSLAALHMLVNQAAASPGRKLILWISPGWPMPNKDQLKMSAEQQQSLFSNIVRLSTEMREKNVRLDAVDPIGTSEDVLQLNSYESFLKPVPSVKESEFGDLGLQVLALQSGGVVMNSSNDISGMLRQCYEQMTAAYALTFNAAPAGHENEYHQLQVEVAGPKLTAHTSTGYYAHPVYATEQPGASASPASK